MRNLEHRVRRLEPADGSLSPKDFTVVWVDLGQSRDGALARRFGAGPQPENVVFVGFTGTDANAARVNLATPDEANTWLREIMQEIDGKSRGLPGGVE